MLILVFVDRTFLPKLYQLGLIHNRSIINEIIIKLTKSEGEGVTKQAFFKSAEELERTLSLSPGDGVKYLKGLTQSYGDAPFKTETIPEIPSKIVIEHPNTNTWSAVPAEYFDVVGTEK